MKKTRLWEIPFMLALLLAGGASRDLLQPILESLKPAWPNWFLNLAASLPGLLPVGAIGYWLFWHFEGPKHKNS